MSKIQPISLKRYPQLTKYHKKFFSDHGRPFTLHQHSQYEGIKADETTLKRKNLATKSFISFLKLMLKLNNFILSCINFLQIKRCAMGTKCAPTYISNFMGIFEEIHIYPLIKQEVQIYFRYIDDKFFILTGFENDLQQFIVNEVHTSIKCDLSYPETQIHFSEIRETISSMGAGEFYKFFKKKFAAQETIDLNISCPSKFFRKYFMAPPNNLSFLFKAFL